MQSTLANLRTDYTAGTLNRNDLHSNPSIQFESWMQQALKADVLEPAAFTLATASSQGRPSARILLLKGAGDNAFTFFSNYTSRKAQDMAENPQAAMLFFWPELQRQIRISGSLSKISRSESQAYFDSRPFESRIGAAASLQSTVLDSRESLEQDVQKLTLEHKDDQSVPLPEHWGGYRITALEYEFWQGRASRLHDRWQYLRSAVDDPNWQINRLYP